MVSFPARVIAAQRRFVRNADGTVALIFGLLVIPLVLGAGVALDFGRAVTAQSDLQRRSDSAALAASRAAAVEMRQCKLGSEVACRTVATKVGEKAGKSFFASLRHSVKELDIDVDVTSDAVTGAWTAKVSFKGEIPTTLMKVGTIEKVNIGGKASASINLGVPTYLNFYLMLDNSSSMGIAASNADMQKMINLTQGKMGGATGFTDVENCVFACHQPAFSNLFYDTPKAQGVRFRIDDLRDATTALIDTAQQAKQINSYMNISMGVYTFNESVHTLSGVTSNLNTVSTAVTALDLPTAPDGTQIADAVHWLQTSATIGNGTGRSAAAPIEIAFLVTDGVENGANTGWRSTTAPTGSGWMGAPLDISGTIPTNTCEGLKQKGVTVAVVYTSYLPFPGTWRYDNMVQPFADKIQPALESCATPGYFYVASEPGDIQKGMQELFQKALNASLLRLTQ